ncbi:MAG: hypothetical protein A2275_09205 [Bacteroidetes bacterium RIFOXYA12_FULL_35_11]|nr:MAG: hypothetical protein A2X01_12805 [Bacteroidetes bacterium GWF2_35_48]OFY77640.1 MAG: hypothetical protein A2275_09205 [Bacteroidetes bacterium RIFOXYA12_FULL_35_11]OFY93407.1 MAG: hypothetical protein A2309_12265 [Bacteroidetes bacterium RIFOXYB2_FULL_35_7]OFY95643.1 MAG: hypothetical protein A2491_12475 [Bacteroidetes bacterium RIFOXYC12_FULL_35_7]HBX50308.1 hypothetical protein [Bacteroidales bacterium]
MENHIETFFIGLTGILGFSIVLEMGKLLRFLHLLALFIISFIGFIFEIYPPAIISTCLLAGDIYMFSKLFVAKNAYNILQVRSNNEYLNTFIEYYKREIYHYSPFYKRNIESSCFLILNNIDVIGVFIVSVQNKKTLYINLDFVIPQYRDFSVGKYIYIENVQYFYNLGYEKILTVCLNETHKNYLIQMGFSEQEINGEKMFVKNLV